MASDVQNLTTFYGNLPSIFENDSIKSLTDQTMTVIDKKNTYQPMFGSFLFTESEPFAHAAFVESTASSIDDKQPIDQTNSIVNTNSNQTIESLPKASIEDSSDIDDIDEDDFDGIPIRHGSSMTKDFSNSDNHLLEQIAQHIEHDDDDDNNNLIDVDDLFLNGFQDEHHQQINETITMPSLFSNIPDIDDLNEHMDDDDDDDENDRDQVPFDHMDMFDQSDSICSSSPDSLLSSSHLREEDDSDDDNYDEDLNRQVNHINIIAKNDDDDDDDVDDVTQWNDDDLLAKTTSRNDRPNAPLPLRVSLNSQSHDQVDFIDSSRSNSRCSNASSHLSNGYTDQARIFINDDDGLVTSSSSSSANSECDEQDRQNLHLDDEIFIRDSDEEPPLQINLDYDRSRSVSTSSSCDSSQSISSPIADQSPIIAIDEDIIETKTQLSSAPIAVVDDEDIVEEEQEEEQKYDNQLLFISNQPVFSSSPLKNLMDLRNEHQKNHIVHDIVNIRHLLNEHNDDDEFLAIMHNPAIFEEVLHVHDDQQKSDLFEQIFLQQSLDNRNESESFEHNENMQQTSLLSISDNDTNSPSTIITTTVPGTRTHSSSTAVNHLREKKNEEEIREEDADVVNRSLIKLDTRQQSQDKNLSNINLTAITNCEKKEQHDHYQMMDSDDGSDNDSELLQTLAQLHGLVHTHRLSNDNNQIDFLMNHEQTDLNNTKQQHQNTANFDDENTSQNIFKDKSTPCVSLSSLSSSVLFNNDESQIQDVVIDSDSSSNSDIQSVVERLVSDTLQRAVEQIDNTHEPIEHFVEQILSEAVYDIFQEDQNDYESKKDNLLPIVQRHNQSTKQIFDPFDQNFHQVWAQDFQTPEYTKELFSSIPPNQAQENLPQSLPIDPFNLSVLTASVKNMNRNNSSSFQDDFTFFMNNASTSETNEQHEEKVQQTDDQDPVPLRDNSDESQTKKHESFFQDQTRLSQFEDFPSEQPLNTQTFETIHSDAGNPFDEPTDIRQSTNGNNDEPWELEEGDEVIKPIPTFISQDQTLITNEPTKTEESDDSTSDSSEDENDKENIDDYFPKEEIQQKQSIDDNNNNNDNDEPTEIIAPKSVRFDDSLQNVTVFTPKDSLVQSEVSSQATTSDTDEYDDEKITTRLSQTTEQINQNSNYTNETTDNAVQRPYSNISLTSEVDSYPPPLPPLPPLEQKPTSANSNILSKSTSSKQASTNNSKGKISLPTTDARLYNNESEFAQSHTSAILRSVSNDDTTNDADEIDNIITCMIDNNEIKIDAKTISPFKCVISSAGQLQDERKTAIIVLYGCWLPNHRLREYRYIMDQLFYYVYHKLQKLVANDYVLVYFHGATPKHQTPELKYLKKCYQMINFRLRKNLRNVYIVHPTLWLRTIVALSRPFFSNKFYHKVQYLYTIAELERQFPNNRIPIPDVIERVEKSGYTPDYV